MPNPSSHPLSPPHPIPPRQKSTRLSDLYMYIRMSAHSDPPSPSSISLVHSVRLSLISCMMVVESLYWSSSMCSMSAMAKSKASLARLQAFEGSFLTSQWNTEKLRARPNLMGWVVFRSEVALAEAAVQASKAESLAFSQASPTETSEMYLKQSPFILQQKTWASADLAPGTRVWSSSSTMSLQILTSSVSIFFLYSLTNSTCLDWFLASSFFSRLSSTLQALLLPPMEFLQATESRFLSSIERSWPSCTTFFMRSSMSSYLSLCSAILAMQTSSSLVLISVQMHYGRIFQFKGQFQSNSVVRI